MDPLYDLMPVLKDQGFGLMVDEKQKRIFANSDSVFITFHRTQCHLRTRRS